MIRVAVGFGIIALLVATTAAEAQTKVYLFTRPVLGGTGQVYTIAPDVPRLASIVAVANAETVGGVHVVPDGSFLAWLGSSGSSGLTTVTLWNPITAATSAILLSQPATGLVGSPTRPEVYLHDAAGPWALSPAGRRPMERPACGPDPSALSPRFVSADGRRIGYVCADGYLAVSETLTGAVVVQQSPLGNYLPALSRDGADLYVVGGSVINSTLIRKSASTGAILGQAALGVAPWPGTIHVDPRTGDVFVVSPDSVRVFDPVTLQPLRSAALELGGFWAFDPHQPRAYTAVSTQLSTTAWATRVSILDTQTLTVIVSAMLPTILDVAAAMVVAPLPAAPASLAATVSGATVQLSWTAGVSNATTRHYLLEAGSAPGLSDIIAGVDLGLQTALAVGGVPPGTYYVRVRAANVTGSSTPSNEVVVTVQ